VVSFCSQKLYLYTRHLIGSVYCCCRFLTTDPMQLTKYNLIIHQFTRGYVNLFVQARALASQQSESDAVWFMVGTQSLKLSHNQVHVVELNEDTDGLLTQVFQHGAGEVWTLAASPSDANLIATCYNTLTDTVTCQACSGSNSTIKLVLGDLSLGLKWPWHEGSSSTKVNNV
jgi:hypothetical protein